MPLDTHIEEDEKSHGRTETRKVEVYKVSTDLSKVWQPLVGYCMVVTRTGMRNNKPFSHVHYYISKHYRDAKEMAKGIRGHWGIESYHWVKDVICLEDDCLTQTTTGAVTLSIMYDVAMNLFKFNGHKSMKAAFQSHANRIDKMIQLKGLI